MLAEDISKRIQDTFASSEKVREGLTDDEALALIDWGIAYADVLAARLTAPERPEMSEEQIDEVGYALTRLMTRLNWLVTYRDKKDAPWLTQTFQAVNKLSREMLGDEAPTISDEQIAAWVAGQGQRANSDLIQNLMTQFAPPEMASPEPTPPTPAEPTSAGPETPALPDIAETPAEEQPNPPAPPFNPLSDSMFGALLRRRQKREPTDNSPESGEEDDE